MRVALLHQTDFQLRRGTTERYRDGLAAHLDAAGHDVTLVLNRVAFGHNGGPVESVHLAAKGSGGLFPALVASWLLRNRQDWAFALAPGLALAAKAAGLRVVYREDGVRAARAGSLDTRRRAVWRAALSTADIVLCHTEECAAVVQEHGARSIGLVAAGVEVQDEHPAIGDDPVVANGWPLSAAGTSQHFPVVAGAFEKVLAHRPDATLLVPQPIAYDGMPAERPAALEGSFEVRPYVLGPDPDPVVPPDAAIVVIDPDPPHEAQVRCQEALVAGRPVVAPAGPWFEDVVPMALGRAYTPGDDDSLAQAIIEVLEMARNPGIAAASRAHGQQWRWDRVGPRVEQYMLGSGTALVA